MAKFVQTTLIDGYAGGPHVTEVQLGACASGDIRT